MTFEPTDVQIGGGLTITTIVVTPAIQAAAAERIPAARDALNRLRRMEGLALQTSRDEASWQRNGGPDIAVREIAAGHALYALTLLAAGKCRDGGYGVVTIKDACRLLA